MAASRLHYMLLAAASILLFIGIAHQHDQVRETLNNAWHKGAGGGSTSNTDQGDSPEPEGHGVAALPPPKAPSNAAPGTPFVASDAPSFHEIALKHGTDKVTTHQYWFMYDKYFPAIRDKKLKMLEIGLGCNMAYGPGKSYYTWLEYFPYVDLYYMEYDAACVDKWAAEASGATIYAGDQADKVFLQKFIDETGGDFDIIIDDGGHTMNQQQVSLEMLWKIVKPGGMYFVEDLQTSFMGVYGGDGTGGKDHSKHTMSKFIYELLDDKLEGDGTRHGISAEMRGIDCMREVCMFHKKEKGTI
ncbi:hypothetical protein PG984_010792 [Apiospora sp. TS-2023a]